MYNKTKYLTSMIGAILAIVLGSLILVSALINFIVLFDTCATAGRLHIEIPAEEIFAVFAGLTIRAVIGAIVLTFGIRTVRKPWQMTAYKSNKKIWVYSEKSKDITLIIFGGIMFFFGIMAGSHADRVLWIRNISWLQWIQNILSLGVFVLKLISVCINGDKYEYEPSTVLQTQSTQKTSITAQNSLENKIKELKHLRDLGVVDEEQYKKSVAKIIEKETEQS